MIIRSLLFLEFLIQLGIQIAVLGAVSAYAIDKSMRLYKIYFSSSSDKDKK